MTALDLILKNMIFSSPQLYPTVWQCYMAIFVDINSGFSFVDKELKCPIAIVEQPVINTDYLECYKAMAVNDVSDLNYEMKLFLHDFIHENIDTIVKTKTVYVEYLEPSRTDLELFLSVEALVWCIDNTYPSEIMTAACHVFKEMKHLLWRDHGKHWSKSRPIEHDSWHESKYHEAYVKVSNKIETLTTTTQRMPV